MNQSAALTAALRGWWCRFRHVHRETGRLWLVCGAWCRLDWDQKGKPGPLMLSLILTCKEVQGAAEMSAGAHRITQIPAQANYHWNGRKLDLFFINMTLQWEFKLQFHVHIWWQNVLVVQPVMFFWSFLYNWKSFHKHTLKELESIVSMTVLFTVILVFF